MEVNEDKAKLLDEAIIEWQAKGIISPEIAAQLKDSYTVRRIDWKQVTVYAFVIAVICGILSVVVLLADKPLRAFIERITHLSDAGISSILTVAGVLSFWYTDSRFRKHPSTPFSNHSFLLLGAFLSIAAISYWAKTLHVFQHNYFMVFLLAAILYIALAIYFRTKALWLLGILMTGIGYGAFSAFYDSDTSKFLGLNFALRFIPFSVLVLLFILLMKKTERLKEFVKIQFITGLLVLYLSLWLATIFGNFNNYERWNQVRQVEFWGWDVLLFVVSLGGMYFGLKRHYLVLGNISLVFFIINLLTRYFEYFWLPLHKSIFFLILAIIFWFIGSRAERLWNLKFLEEK